MHTIRIALGVVRNFRGEILVSYRSKQQDQGGCWEFPGGKLESGETFKSALRREIFEETGLEVRASRQLIQFSYSYPSRHLLFCVFLVEDPIGRIDVDKCPSCRWHTLDNLLQLPMPDANKIIVDALTLPPVYMITQNSIRIEKIVEDVYSALERGVRLVQLRAHDLSREDYTQLAHECYRLCDRFKARLIVNCELEWLDDFPAHGFHLSSDRLRRMLQHGRPVIAAPLFSVSCHNLEEIRLANQLHPACALIAPVLPTQTHSSRKALDWSGFQRLALQTNVPVYSLGGLDHSQIAITRAHGGHGVAGIRMFIPA